MSCKNKNTYFNEVREKGKEGRKDGREERIELFNLFVGTIYIILMNCI